MRCKWLIENSTWRIVPKILYSPNRTNRSNRQASTRVPEYCEIFLSVANEMQMADRKPSQKFSVRQIERSDEIELPFFPIESSWQYWTTLDKIWDTLGRGSFSNRQLFYEKYRKCIQGEKGHQIIIYWSQLRNKFKLIHNSCLSFVLCPLISTCNLTWAEP